MARATKPSRSFEQRAVNNRPLQGSLVLRREWIIASDIQHIEPLVAEVVQLCLEAGLSPRACRLNVPVAFTEALSNAILRGNDDDSSRRVKASCTLDLASVTLEVTDEGDGFDASCVTFSPHDADWLDREDGRGLFLMRSLMDRVEIQRPAHGQPGNLVRLVLNRA